MNNSVVAGAYAHERQSSQRRVKVWPDMAFQIVGQVVTRAVADRSCLWGHCALLHCLRPASPVSLQRQQSEFGASCATCPRDAQHFSCSFGLRWQPERVPGAALVKHLLDNAGCPYSPRISVIRLACRYNPTRHGGYAARAPCRASQALLRSCQMHLQM